MNGEGREGCSCFVWSNGVWFHLFKNISWDISSKKSWSPIMLPPNTLEIVSVGDAQITKAGSCGIGDPFFIDEWWVKFPWAAMALPLLDVGFRFAWGWWGFEHGGVVIKCYVLFDSNKDEHFFKSQSISIPPQKKTNNKYEFCSLSTLDLYLPQTSCRIQGIPEDLSTSPPPPPDTAPVHIRFAWSFARRCMRCLRALEACSFFSKAMLCLVGTS